MCLAEDAKNANVTEFMETIRKARDILEECRTKSLAGSQTGDGIIDVYDLENLVVISDLHGDSNSLFRILSEINYDHFLLKELNKLVFLGDYVDRGMDSLSIIYTICRLKSSYPDSVILLRGNHEAPAEFPFSPHDLPYKTEERFGQRWRGIYKETLALFRALTILMRVRDRLLLVHGGLPADEVSAIKLAESLTPNDEIQFKSNNSMLEEFLWNDPRDLPEDKRYARSRRGLGRYFGPTVTRTWLKETGTRALIRGHEPCRGFKLDHNNKIITLFSCRDIYPNSTAAYLITNRARIDSIKDAKDLSDHVKFLV